MIIATPTAGLSSGYMLQFKPYEARTIAAALALYVDAEESDMSGDRSPESAIATARNLARRFKDGLTRTEYSPAQIVAIYDALSFFVDSALDFPAYWEHLPGDIDAIRAKCAGMIETLEPHALECWQTDTREPDANSEETTFTGKSGRLITITRNGRDDYEAWLRDSETSAENDGYSVRGSLLDVIRDIITEF